MLQSFRSARGLKTLIKESVVRAPLGKKVYFINYKVASGNRLNRPARALKDLKLMIYTELSNYSSFGDWRTLSLKSEVLVVVTKLGPVEVVEKLVTVG